MFTTTASRLSVSDLPQFLLICCKLLQTKTTLPLPLRSLPPIHHASNPKVFFTSLSSLPHSLSQHPLLCRPHTWRAASRPIWHAQITTKKGKKKKKVVVFWPRRLLCIFIWREQSNLFSFHQEPNGMAMPPHILTNQPRQKRGGKAGISSRHTGTFEQEHEAYF